MFGSNNDNKIRELDNRIGDLEFTVSQINLQLNKTLPIIANLTEKVNTHQNFLVNHKESMEAIIRSIKFIDRETIGDIREDIKYIKNVIKDNQDAIKVNQDSLINLTEIVRTLSGSSNRFIF